MMRAEECLCHWHRDHRCSGDPKVCHFVTKGFFYATALYGNPTSSVNEVTVVLRPDPSPETVEVQTGVFTIYIPICRDPRTGPDDYWFHALLAHEIAHLLNAHLFDCYVEGLNGIFAEELLTRTSVGSERYRQYLEGQRCVDTSEAFYAVTYFLMKDLSREAGEEHMRNFLGCATWTDSGETRMHIDIDQWLDSLPRDKKVAVKAKIREHAPSVNRARQHDDRQQYVFRLPKDDC